jgi:hypothetical protein
MPISSFSKMLALLSLFAFGYLPPAQAQEFPPKKTITIVVGFAPVQAVILPTLTRQQHRLMVQSFYLAQ